MDLLEVSKYLIKWKKFIPVKIQAIVLVLSKIWCCLSNVVGFVILLAY